MNSPLLRKFIRCRSLSTKICEPLEIEDFTVQTLFDVSPIKWHLGHTTWFFETLILKKLLKNYSLFHETFPYMFNSYYNSLGDRVSKDLRGIMSRPTVNHILEYREYVNSHMSHYLENNDLPKEYEKLIEIGINHEQQHQELMIYDIKHIYFTNPMKPIYSTKKNIDYADIKIEYISFDEEVSLIGAELDSNFAFDNEYSKHKYLINPFKLRNTLVNNGEYLDFINDNGYNNHELWLDDAWTLLKDQTWQKPIYWKKEDGQWFEWTMHGYEILNKNKALSHISYYEADAFATWANKRLASEQEWEHAAKKTNMKNTNFLDDLYFDTIQTKNDGFYDLFGNVWEWTSSSYNAHYGYKKPKGAIGEYNSKFMSGQMVLKGGSYATLQEHFRKTYRNFFQADKRWLISGIRLAETM